MPGLCAVRAAYQRLTMRPRAFIENKRYPAKPRRVGDVVNPNADSVYQTDAVLILIGRVRRRPSGAPMTNSTEYVDEKNLPCAPRGRVLAWRRDKSSRRDRWCFRTARDLRGAARAGGAAGARGIQHGRRLH